MDQMGCSLCPRACYADRSLRLGFCGAGQKTTVAKIMLHRWEEPCICFGNGSGAVFFSGCQLQCVFCQNYDISCRITGQELEEDELSLLFLRLQEKGACNVNLVSPTPYIPQIARALIKAKNRGLALPVVFNSGGYESVEALRIMDGLVDIYMPDYKFFDPVLSLHLAHAADYAKKAEKALEEMYRQVQNPIWSANTLQKGLLIRHLILPNQTRDSIAVLDRIYQLFGKNGSVLSLMRQYTPIYKANNIPELSRPITTLEYQRVVKHAEKLGFTSLITQSKASATSDYIPDFQIFEEFSS